MLRKMVKKAKNKKKTFVRHPYRLQEETKFAVKEKTNEKLLSLYDSATLLRMC